MRLLAKAFAVEILYALNDGEGRRFADLKDVCPNEKTRATRLRELKKHGLIDTAIKEVGNRSFIIYMTTEKGKEALRIIKQLESL